MQRRAFLAGASVLAGSGVAAAGSVVAPPRKVIVGTMVQSFWVEHPGINRRLEELSWYVDSMSAQAKARYGRGLDLAVLPETVITGETGRETLKRSVPWEGEVRRVFSSKARQHGCYIVAPTYLREADNPNRCSNAALLVDRKGELAGIYRKIHLVPSPDGTVFEGGATPGREARVFDCDFGKLGIQICYDMEFDYGWKELARQGVELIAWATQSPQTAQPAARAAELGCYIVSSTWRHNASVFEPTGKIVAQTTEPGTTLAQEIDLSYALLPWSAKLQRGKLFDEHYGARAGYRYYVEEDLGIFWSNDPRKPIGTMVRELGLEEASKQLERSRAAYRAAGVPGY